jgi:hypothetical protein
MGFIRRRRPRPQDRPGASTGNFVIRLVAALRLAGGARRGGHGERLSPALPRRGGRVIARVISGL